MSFIFWDPKTQQRALNAFFGLPPALSKDPGTIYTTSLVGTNLRLGFALKLSYLEALVSMPSLANVKPALDL